MKSLLIIVLLVFTFISCKNEDKKANSIFEKTKTESIESQFESENFFIFFQDFCKIEEYQFSRIEFPLTESVLSEDLNSTINKVFKRSDWKFIEIKKFENNSFDYYYNDFSKTKIPDSDEKVYSIIGIENGIAINYYFKRIKGKWFLVKIEDLST